MIDPFDEVEKEKIPDTTRIRILYEKIYYVFKIILILISLVIIGFLIVVTIVPEKGLVIQSFESTQQNLSSVFIANHLYFELQDIKEINDKNIMNIGNSKVQSDYSSGSTHPEHIPTTLLPANSIDYCITGLGNVGFEGTSLSLGQLVLSIKQFIGRSTPILTGCIERSRSNLRIIAILNDADLSEGTAAWEICKNISENGDTSEEDIPIMIEDLAFQIDTTLIKEKNFAWWDIFHLFQFPETNPEKYPKTWEAFKNLTLSRKAYNRYNATGNISDLNNSRDFAFIANKSEPGFSEMPKLFSLLGYSYLKHHKYPDAVQLFKNATHLGNSYAAVPWNGIGLVYFEKGDYEESIQAFDNATNLNASFGEAWYNKGIALYKKKDYKGSIQAYNRSINLTPNDSDAYSDALTNKGASLLALGNYDQAFRTFNEAININPNDAFAWNNKGLAALKQHDADAAIQAFDMAIKINPRYSDAWNNKGSALGERGNYTDAIRAFDMAIEIDPHFADALNNKGLALAKQSNTMRPSRITTKQSK